MDTKKTNSLTDSPLGTQRCLNKKDSNNVSNFYQRNPTSSYPYLLDASKTVIPTSSSSLYLRSTPSSSLSESAAFYGLL